MPITKKDMFEAGTQAGQSFSNAFMGMLSLRAEEKMQDDERRREAREATNQLGTALDTYRQMYPDLNIPDEPLGDMSPDMAGQLFRLIGAGASQKNAAAIARDAAGSAEERAIRAEGRANRQKFIENERAFDRDLSLLAVKAGLESAGAGAGAGAGEGDFIARARRANQYRGFGKSATAPLARLVLGGETGYATYPKDGKFTDSTARSTYTSGLPAEMYSAVRYEYNQGKNPSQIANILFPGIQDAPQLEVVTQAIGDITAISSQQDQENAAFYNSVFPPGKSDESQAAIEGDPNLPPEVEQIVGDYDEAMAGTIDNPPPRTPVPAAEEQAAEATSAGRSHDPRTPPWTVEEPSPGGDTGAAATAAVTDSVQAQAVERAAATAAVTDSVQTPAVDKEAAAAAVANAAQAQAVEKAAASAALATAGSDTGVVGPAEEVRPQRRDDREASPGIAYSEGEFDVSPSRPSLFGYKFGIERAMELVKRFERERRHSEGRHQGKIKQGRAEPGDTPMQAAWDSEDSRVILKDIFGPASADKTRDDLEAILKEAWERFDPLSFWPAPAREAQRDFNDIIKSFEEGNYSSRDEVMADYHEYDAAMREISDVAIKVHGEDSDLAKRIGDMRREREMALVSVKNGLLKALAGGN